MKERPCGHAIDRGHHIAEDAPLEIADALLGSSKGARGERQAWPRFNATDDRLSGIINR